MELVNVPGVQPGSGGSAASVAEFSPKPDAATEASLAALEAQIKAGLSGQQVPPAPAPVPAPMPEPAPLSVAEPPAAPPQAQPAPVPIPPKFQNPDGTLNEQRLDKSTLSAAEALAKYEALERELRAKQQTYAQPQQFQPAFAPQMPQYPDPSLAFEQRLQADLAQNPAATLIRLHNAAIEAARAQAAAESEGIRRQLELQTIAQQDPAVFTAEGIDRLSQVKRARPELSYTDAYWISRGMYGPIGNPAPAMTPQAQPQPVKRPSAPVLGGGGAPVVPAAAMPVPTTEAELRSHLQQKFGHLSFEKKVQAENEYLAQIYARAGRA